MLLSSLQHIRLVRQSPGRHTLVPFGSKTWEESLPVLTAVLSAVADFLPIMCVEKLQDNADQLCEGSFGVHDANMLLDADLP